MGLFLSASGIVSPDTNAIREAIASYVASTGGTFELREGTPDDSNIGVLQSSGSTTTVLYPDGWCGWDDLSLFLSVELDTPVFSFHIHDGDLWMFVAFDKGNEVAWFNPIPDYWGRVDDAERGRWSGDAEVVASLIPGLQAEAVERYFITWTDEAIDAEQKAYADDEFPIGVDWQLADFMRRLGFVYPVDDSGTPTGDSFYLESRRRPPASLTPSAPQSHPSNSPYAPKQEKPWWKLW